MAEAPTAMPSMMVTILHRAFCAVSDRRLVRPDSLKRLPSISMPTSGIASGTMRETTIVATMGKSIFSLLETGLSCFISIMRSFLDVSSFIMGG